MNPSYKMKYLRGRRLKIFLAVADTVLPKDEDSPGGGTAATAGVVDWAMQRIPAKLRGQFMALLYIVEFLGLFFGGRFFSGLSPINRERQLAWMEKNPVRLLRMGFFGLKNYASMGYYTREEVWKTIGFEGPLRPDVPYADPDIRGLCQGTREAAP